MFHTIAIQGGYVVAYRRPSGELNAVSDHANRATAEREAAQRNELIRAEAERQRAEVERQRLRAIANDWPSGQRGKRSVRYFEPDAFA